MYRAINNVRYLKTQSFAFENIFKNRKKTGSKFQKFPQLFAKKPKFLGSKVKMLDYETIPKFFEC